LNNGDSNSLTNIYEGRARLIKGDQKRLDKICEFLNEINLKRDGFVKQGVNRSNYSHAIQAAIDSFVEKNGLQSVKSVDNMGYS
jgi:hypothetical protein